LPRSVAAAAVFFLQQIPVESQAEEAALESECLPAVESLQAGRAPLPPLVAVAAEVPPLALRAFEKPQPLPNGSPKQHQAPSRNTTAEVADK